MYRIQRTNLTSKKEQYTMFNKVILIGRLGKNAEAKTAQNKKDYAVLSIATSETWKNDKGEYETRTEWHRVYAWGNLSNFAKALLKGQFIALQGKIKYRTVEQDVEGKPLKHTIAEIHASSMRRLSKVPGCANAVSAEITNTAAADPADGADEE
jgi:single-strand DNA-binding protein